MTRKDFELIAATLKAQRNALLLARHLGGPDYSDAMLKAHSDLATDFAHRLKDTNKQFNRDKFLHACGVVLT